MKLLIADDDTLFRTMLRQMFCDEYELEIADDGDAAWAAFQTANAPQLAIPDWIMPGLSGPQICRNVRAQGSSRRPYILLFTARNNRAEVIAGFEAGADDCITKPFHEEELGARLKVGKHVIELQNALEDQVAATRSALTANEILRKATSPCNQCPKADECLQLAPPLTGLPDVGACDGRDLLL